MIQVSRVVEDDLRVVVNAIEGETVLGVAAARRRELPYGQVAVARTYAELLTLEVVQDVRRRGVGTRLVRDVLSWAHDRGYSHVSVEASARRPGVDRFYRELGFEPRSVVYDVALD